MTDPTGPRDHPRLTRYILTRAGMAKDRWEGVYNQNYHFIPGPYVLASEADAEIDRLRAKVKQQRMQLPKGMEHCTIHFIECEVGHGRLTATNWIDHVCHWCKIDAKDRELDRLRADVERLTAKLREEQELVEVNLSRMYDRALAYMRERDQLRAEVERLRSAPHCPTCGCWR